MFFLLDALLFYNSPFDSHDSSWNWLKFTGSHTVRSGGVLWLVFRVLYRERHPCFLIKTTAKGVALCFASWVLYYEWQPCFVFILLYYEWHPCFVLILLYYEWQPCFVFRVLYYEWQPCLIFRVLYKDCQPASQSEEHEFKSPRVKLIL